MERIREVDTLFNLGVGLKEWRLIIGMSEEQAGEAAGLSRNTVRKIEAGEGGSIKTLFALLGVYGIADDVEYACRPWGQSGSRALYSAFRAENRQIPEYRGK